MKGNFDVAEYALEIAYESAFDAEMKDPSDCVDFIHHMYEARGHLMAAKRALADWRGEE